MTIRAAKTGIFLVALLAVIAPIAAHAADEIKAGKWLFTTQMQMPAMPQSPGAPVHPGGTPSMTRTACIDPANPVPAETQQGNVQCKLDKMQRKGATVTWSMTCNAPQGPPNRSDGVARYTGDTMEASVTAHMTTPNGQTYQATFKKTF